MICSVARICLAALSLTVLNLPCNSQTLNSLLKRSSFVVMGPSGDGTGFSIGQKDGFIYFLSAAHVVGQLDNESEVSITDEQFESVEVIQRFPGKDIVLARFRYSDQNIIPLIINSFLPYPSPNTPESAGIVNLKSSVNTVTGKSKVSGFSLPTSAIKIRVHRVIDSEIVQQISGNKDGYDLLYQASTIPGMSGGPVIGYRDCSNNGGFALGISPASVFPVLLAVHGRSEGYGDQGRSGISLGVPIEGDIKRHLANNANTYGIRVGESQIRGYVNTTFCVGGKNIQEILKQQNMQFPINTPGFSF